MLTAGQKFSLMCMYMRPVLIVSGVGSFAAFVLMATAGTDILGTTAVIASLLKMLILVASVVLLKMLGQDSQKFFYINLGVPVKKLLLWGTAFDLGIFYAGLIIILVVRYGIG